MLLLEGHSAPVASLCYTPCGERLLSASLDGTVRLWDRRTAENLAVIADNDGAIHCAVFSPDGRRFATAGDDAMVRIYDARTLRLETTYTGSYWSMRSLAWSPDGGLLAAGSSDRVHGSTVVVWQARDGQKAAACQIGHFEIHQVVFAPNGQHVAIASARRELILWSPTALPFISSGDFDPGHAGLVRISQRAAVRGVSFCENQKWFATGEGARVVLWELRTARVLRAFSDHRQVVTAVTFAPGASQLASAGADGRVCLCRADGSRDARQFDWRIGPVADVAFAPDGQTAAVAGAAGVLVWDVDE